MPPGNEPVDKKQYDFLLQNQVPPKKSLPLPHLPKPVLIGLGVIIILFLIIILGSLFSSGKKSGPNQKLVNLAAQETEIARVSGLVINQSKDSDATSLAATVQASLSSEAAQMANYLGLKATDKSLSADQNKDTDSQLTTASQNNNLEPTYYNYLKQQLNSLSATANDDYKAAASGAKPILKTTYDNAQALLAASKLKQ